MRKITVLYLVLIVIALSFSCEEPAEPEAGFEDVEEMTIYDYLVENEEEFSSFLRILEIAGIDKTLSAYNPEGLGYTLFLPTNEAISNFIEDNSNYSSLNDLLNDVEYVSEFGRYHVVMLGIHSNEFPFGALPEFTFTQDLLTVSFIIEPDTSYYKINNQAPVIRPDIELSNGYIQVIGKALVPITFTSYDWLEQDPGLSIFKSLIDATGFREVIDINLKDETVNARSITMLVEPDSVYEKRNIHDLEDLAAVISPDNSDYTSTANSLHNYAGYHILEETWFLNDFVENIPTNYITYSEVPLFINGRGLEIKINPRKEVFDTIIEQGDTVIIDFVGFLYDESNVITQSGAIQFINQVMKQQVPSRANSRSNFTIQEPLLYEYSLEPGEYLIEDTSWLKVIKWSGADLYYVKSDDEESPAWSGDYLFMDGDFYISYTFPKLIQGKYTAYLGAEAFTAENALVQVYIDGKNIGGIINLASGGSSSNPFVDIELGAVNFLKYEEHTIEVRSLVPGSFFWDYILFEPL
jgi:uncharacterized surface protein with fasciclin (FAS1) repeats